MTFRTRFAPSPTGPLHLGHAYSACLAHDMARQHGGQFFLRMDDIDQSRARAAWAVQIQADLQWLGVRWDGEIWSQQGRADHYTKALRALWHKGLLYACRCSRADVRAAANAPQEGSPRAGPDGIVYPGTCRATPTGPFPEDQVLRLNMKKAMQDYDIDAIKFTEGDTFFEKSQGDMCRDIGDVVLARRNMAAAYHLAIVVDDAEQDITHVIRGEDLRDATFIHVLLQHLLGFGTPRYIHHRLVRDENGRRLAKRDDARAISNYRADGLSPAQVRRLAGLAE